MEYSIYKMKFTTGVHFGTGLLNDTAYAFPADMLFSALYIEALKQGKEELLYEAVKQGQLLFSDAFPYVGKDYLIPKPMIYVETANQGDSVEKKRYKKLKYLPVTQLEHFLAGQLDFESDWEEMGCFQQQTMASVRREEEETRPFQVGTYYYKEGNGLYIIAAYEKTEYEELLEDLLDAVSLTGIGGKKSSGMGKFQLIKEKNISEWKRYLTQESDRYILLSSALPRDEELENALEHASYLLSKRSGFVASERYADEWRKKKDLYVFTAGSCFQNRFQGDIFDVSMGGNHPVYRYAKPLFMGVQVK